MAKTILIFALLFVVRFSQAQQYYRVTYEFSSANELYQGLEQEYSLEFSNKSSICIYKSEYFENKTGKWEVEIPEKYTFNTVDEGIFKNYSVLETDTTVLEKKVPIYKWEITEETQTIAGYKAYKAIAKAPEDTNAFLYPNGMDGFIEYVYAWYTPDLPYQYGPTEFVGLPGVVLKVEFSNIEESLEAITVTKIKEPTVQLPKYPIKITMDAIYSGKWYKKGWRKKQKQLQYPQLSQSK
ncbi:GLPGLI family protein [Flammeovirga sp. OC4]|uniref:GLPGLI family protein n=1 Tax=Flammeovirga sp. OC4 TaxID=1382345 RepID=UPI0005C69AF2|nr:GLPGLI family protein [Flammeovirga sp. OC4]